MWAALILGIVSGVACKFGTKIKHFLKIDDTMDIFTQHGLAGIIGLIFNGLFATNAVISLDGVNLTTLGGVLDGNFKQMGIQITYIVVCSVFVFVSTAGLVKTFSFIRVLNLRASEHAELIGIDEDQIGEFIQDFVEVQREYNEWGPIRTTTPFEKGLGVTGLRHHITLADDHRSISGSEIDTPQIPPLTHMNDNPLVGSDLLEVYRAHRLSAWSTGHRMITVD